MSVYFITCREVTAVKIGSSVDPWGRLPEIQVGCPLPLMLEAVLPGGAEQEFAFHNWFSNDRIRGEWFTITGEIELLIKENPAPPKRERREAAPINPMLARAMPSERKRYEKAIAEMRAAQAFKLEAA